MDARPPPRRPPKSQEPLDKQAASRLAGAFSTVHLRQGETVAAEGDTVERCYLIEYGSVEVSTTPGHFARSLRSCSAEYGKHVLGTAVRGNPFFQRRKSTQTAAPCAYRYACLAKPERRLYAPIESAAGTVVVRTTWRRCELCRLPGTKCPAKSEEFLVQLNPAPHTSPFLAVTRRISLPNERAAPGHIDTARGLQPIGARDTRYASLDSRPTTLRFAPNLPISPLGR